MQTLETLTTTLQPAIIPLRATQHLGSLYRPSEITHDGIAVWIQIDQTQPILVSSFAHLSEATEISIWINEEWIEAQLLHNTHLFDLTQITADNLTPPTQTFSLALTPQINQTIMTISPVSQNENGELHFGSFGEHPSGNWNYYLRSLSNVRNGYPLFNANTELVAITSVHALDERGGVFAIPAEQIQLWIEYWPRNSENSPVEWRPNIEQIPYQITTGNNALQ